MIYLQKRGSIEEKVFEFVKKCVNEKDFTDVTVKDIGDQIGYTGSSVSVALKNLEKQGEIKRERLKDKPGKVKRIFLVRRDSE